jgi:2-aminoethylphosphonate-pyruvate transaminase
MINKVIPDNPYLLLTPGPLSTSKTVKSAMLKDWCTWDDEYNLEIVQSIRRQLVKLATESENDYSSILMQGSGTFSVEAVIGSILPEDGILLILSNGAYGSRMIQISEVLKIPYLVYEVPETETFTVNKLENILSLMPAITHIAVVHCETTTGMLNPVKEISSIAKKFNKTVIVDAMSSFGGIPFDIEKWGIDILISSANKCIQGVPGFGFIIIKKDIIKNSEGIARSHSLDLFDQWKTMENKNGKWRFTSPTHVVRAFAQALEELEQEGGIIKRHERYTFNHKLLVEGMREIGFRTLLPDELQSPVITSFLFPENRNFDFNAFYNSLKNRGFVIYPGKISAHETFRVGNIGEIYPNDINRLITDIKIISNVLNLFTISKH